MHKKIILDAAIALIAILSLSFSLRATTKKSKRAQSTLTARNTEFSSTILTANSTRPSGTPYTKDAKADIGTRIKC